MPALGLGLGLAKSLLGAPAFVGALDALVAQGATFLHVSSVRRLLSSYAGAAMKLSNGLGTLGDIEFLTDGSLDLDAVAALDDAGGGLGVRWHTAYDQAEVVDATQTVAINQMEFGTANQTKGEMGGASGAAQWLDLNLGTLPQPSFFAIVVNVGGVASSRILLGSSATNSNRYIRLNGAAPQQHWGVSLSGSNISAGKHLFGFLSNGASSKIYMDGSLDVTGDAGNTQLDLSGGRIGSALSATTNWTITANNTISEVVVFNGDPTGLAGWADFVANQKAYFGVS